RLKAAIGLMPPGRRPRLLDVGHGSGVLLRQLQGHAEHLFGVDHHDYHVPVREYLAKHGVAVRLARGDAMALPFESEAFDIVSCVSVLEHVPDVRLAVRELRRVLKPGGVLIAGFPPKNRLTAACFRIIGFDHDRFHPNTERDILSALADLLTIDFVWSRPSRAPLFILARCMRKSAPP
ncbi:MAG: class I SAM-dependent methyltransferase, partial [Candidatus Eisenbacteria bacterium]|nr:class I SAM-dependent methyltransferase [Candidatus Eisenbacteria bacterium]